MTSHLRLTHALIGAMLTATTVAQTYTFQLRPEIAKRQSSGAAYDSARNRVVVAGGRGSTSLVEWDGQSWEERLQSPAPGSMTEIANSMAYDSARRQVVGYAGGETWLWDGRDWTQYSGPQPTPTTGTAMAFDPVRQKTILFGGETSSGLFSETWEWDGASWTQLAPASSPAARKGMGMAWDEANQGILMFGGATGFTSFLADTWLWDGVNWSQRSPALSPPANASRAMASDPVRRRVVHVTRIGGSLSTWEWDGATWARIATQNTPGAALFMSLVFDGTTNRTMLAFGAAGINAETWLFDGVDWTLADARRNFSVGRMVEDASRGRLVAFGANAFPDFSTVEWDGVSWQFPSSSMPVPLVTSAPMAFDGASQTTLVFGGTTNQSSSGSVDDTWSWDGANWTLLSPATRPSPRRGSALGYHAASGRTVLFAGETPTATGSVPSSETWLWDGTNWQLASTAVTPPTWIFGGFAYDSFRQRLVLAGAKTLAGVSQTWEWDGASWSQVVGATPPDLVGTYHANTAFDPTTGWVLYSGVSFSRNTRELWAFDGTTWRQVASPPEAGPIAFDNTIQRLVLAGDSGSTWLGSSQPIAPADVVEYGTGCAGTLGVPSLTARGMPYPGNDRFLLELASGRPGSIAAVLLSDLSASIAVAGCTQLVDPNNTAWWVSTSGGGAAELLVPIPLSPMFLGFSLSAQGVVLDPMGAAAGLLAATAGLRFTIGD